MCGAQQAMRQELRYPRFTQLSDAGTAVLVGEVVPLVSAAVVRGVAPKESCSCVPLLRSTLSTAKCRPSIGSAKIIQTCLPAVRSPLLQSTVRG
jgi:hypothetical protein